MTRRSAFRHSFKGYVSNISTNICPDVYLDAFRPIIPGGTPALDPAIADVHCDYLDMTNHFLVTAGALLVLNLLGNALISGTPDSYHADVGIINTSGQQRMLTSEINRHSNEFVFGDKAGSPDVAKSLALLIDSMYANHNKIIASNPSSEVHQLLFQSGIDKRLRDYLDLVENLARSNDTSVNRETLQAIRATAPGLIDDFHVLTEQIVADQSVRKKASFRWNIGGMIFSTVALALVGFFVFYPIEKQLHHHTVELEDQVAERTRELEVYKLTLENISDAVFITDADGKFEFMCPNAEVIFGYTPDELRKFTHIEQLIGEDLYQKGELLVYGELENIEREITDKHGQKHYLLISVKRVSFDGSSIMYMCRDVTRLRETQEDLDNFFNLNPDMMCIAKSDGYPIRLNRAVVETLGWDEAEFMSKPFYDFVHPDDLVQTQRRVRTLEEGGSQNRFENRYLCSNGSYRWLEWTSRLDCSGKIYSVARDVTEQKHFEAELIAARKKAEEMNRLKDIFLSNMSHEIRTPVAAIIASADLMAYENYEDKTISEFITFISEAGNRLMRTFNSVLELAQLESNNLELRAEPLNLVKEVREVVDLFKVQTDRKQLELSFDSDSVNIPVTMDKGALGRIIMNLVGNAVKFTHAGSVSVHVGNDGDRARITVADSGIGISDDFIPQLFEEFQQESSGLDRVFEGNGLGLTVTRQLVQLMGGTILVQSKKNEGSTFTVILPKIYKS